MEAPSLFRWIRYQIGIIDLLCLLQELCIPERQVVGWFDIIDKERFQPENFPVFIIHDDRGYYYGFPPFENPGDNTILNPVF